MEDCKDRCTSAKDIYVKAATCDDNKELGCRSLALIFILWSAFLYITVVSGMCIGLQWWQPEAILCKSLNFDFTTTFTIGLLVLILLSLFCLPLFFCTAVPSWMKCLACDEYVCEIVSNSIPLSVVFIVVGLTVLLIAVLLFGWVPEVEPQWCSGICIPYDSRVEIYEPSSRRLQGGNALHGSSAGRFQRQLSNVVPVGSVTTAFEANSEASRSGHYKCTYTYKVDVYPCGFKDEVDIGFPSQNETMKMPRCDGEVFKDPVPVNATRNSSFGRDVTVQPGEKDTGIGPSVTAKDAYPQPEACAAHSGAVGILELNQGALWCNEMYELQASVYYNSTPEGPRLPYECIYPVDPYKGSLIPENKLAVYTNYAILMMQKGDYRIAQGVYNYNFMVIGSSLVLGIGLFLLVSFIIYCKVQGK